MKKSGMHNGKPYSHEVVMPGSLKEESQDQKFTTDTVRTKCCCLSRQFYSYNSCYHRLAMQGLPSNDQRFDLALSQLAFFAVYFLPRAFRPPPAFSSSFLNLLRSPSQSTSGSMHMLQPFSSCTPCLQNREQPLKYKQVQSKKTKNYNNISSMKLDRDTAFLNYSKFKAHHSLPSFQASKNPLYRPTTKRKKSCKKNCNAAFNHGLIPHMTKIRQLSSSKYSIIVLILHSFSQRKKDGIIQTAKVIGCISYCAGKSMHKNTHYYA